MEVPYSGSGFETKTGSNFRWCTRLGCISDPMRPQVVVPRLRVVHGPRMVSPFAGWIFRVIQGPQRCVYASESRASRGSAMGN